MSGSNASIDDPPPFFLSNELHGLSFRLKADSTAYKADDTSEVGMVAWTSYVARVANVRGNVEWRSLEKRAHFLNNLFVFCQRRKYQFPFEIDTKIFPHLQEKI